MKKQLNAPTLWQGREEVIGCLFIFNIGNIFYEPCLLGIL